MEQRLKQRWIGATVLVALAVIFIPMLLQGSPEREPTAIPIAIPPQPKVEVPPPAAMTEPSAPPATAFTPTAPVDAAPPQTPQAAAEAEPAFSPVAAQEPLATMPSTPPDLAAWAVQVGSFSNEANARKLRDSLRRKGYTAYTESIQNQGKTFYRVRVGPTTERRQAEQLQAALASKESLRGLVVPHP